MYQFSAVIFSCIGHPFNETLSFSPQAALKVGSVMLHLSQIHFCGWNFKKDWTCCSIRFISYIYDVCVSARCPNDLLKKCIIKECDVVQCVHQNLNEIRLPYPRNDYKTT